MARKDASRAGSLPVDNYRKAIGKHDVHQDKKGLTKEIKNRKDAKTTAMSIKDIVLVFGACLAIVVCIYFAFYFYIAPASSS